MLEILAVLLSPLIAFGVGVVVTDRKEKLRRRHALFQSLWLTRGDIGSSGRMSYEHVRALNMIEIEFSAPMENYLENTLLPDSALWRIRNCWEEYRRFLNLIPRYAKSPNYPSVQTVIWKQRDDLLVDLIYEISQVLRYPFDKAAIRAAYAPAGYADFDLDTYAIRKAVRGLVEGMAQFILAPHRQHRRRLPATMASCR